MLDNATLPFQNPSDNIGNAFPHLSNYIDPWGNPYQYASPPVRTRPGSPLPNNWINRECN